MYTPEVLGEVTWLIIHNFSEEERSFEHEKIQSAQQVVLSNYDEVKMENGQAKLRAYENSDSQDRVKGKLSFHRVLFLQKST